MIEIDSVSKTFDDKPAVNDVSLRIEGGETMVLIGPSGCGKTTLLKLINKLYDADRGSIFVNGENIGVMDPIALRRRMGYVVQEVGLFPHLSLYDNIALIPRILKWKEPDIRKKVDELSDLLNIGDIDLIRKYSDQISGGQRQRVGIARALITDPDIILLDEPFGALDPITHVHIRKEFGKLEHILRKTMVMVTHDVGEALELADRITILNQGGVEQTGTPAELLFKPATPFVREFFREDLFKHQMEEVRIADILPMLSGIEGDPGHAQELDPDTRIFFVFNQWVDQGALFKIIDNGDPVIMNAETIMRAFLDFVADKTRSDHE